MPKIVLSTGLFSKYPDYSDFLKVVGFIESHKDWFYELIVYPNWIDKLDEYRNVINARKLPVVAVHADKMIVCLLHEKSNFEQGLIRLRSNFVFAESIKAEYLVVHLWERPHYESSLSNILSLVNREALTHLKQTKLSIETIPSKNESLHDLLEQCLRYLPSAQITLDTELFSWQNNLFSLFDHKMLIPRINNIHLRDYDGKPFSGNNARRYLSLGKGYLNFPTFFHKLESVNFHGNVTIENSALEENGEINLQKIAREMQQVKKWLGV